MDRLFGDTNWEREKKQTKESSIFEALFRQLNPKILSLVMLSSAGCSVSYATRQSLNSI